MLSVYSCHCICSQVVATEKSSVIQISICLSGMVMPAISLHRVQASEVDLARYSCVPKFLQATFAAGFWSVFEIGRIGQNWGPLLSNGYEVWEETVPQQIAFTEKANRS